MSQYTIIEKKDGVCTIQLNRPDKKNALNQAMYAEIAEGIMQADQDPKVRVVVVTGTEGMFTSGNDIKDFQDRAETGGSGSKASMLMNALLDARKPLIAAVNGYAIGIGTTMLFHFDLVYAGKSAQFSLPFVNLGLCPEFGSSFMLPVLAGRHRASELLMLGDRFSPEEAHEIGLVNRIFSDDSLMDDVLSIAKQLAEKPPTAVRATKKLIRGYNPEVVREAVQTDGGVFRELMSTPEAKEAFQAFSEKRKPDFSKFE